MLRRASTGVVLAFALAGWAERAQAWTSPQNISNQPSGSRAFGPKIARDPLGNIHLVWAGGVDPASNWKAWYQMFNRTSWSAPIALSGSDATRPAIAVDGNGTVHVVYEETAEDNIWYRKKPAGGSWTAPLNLRTGGRSIASSIAVNPAGDRIIVAWHEDNQVGAEWDIFANICDGSAWSGTFNVSSNSATSTNPAVCIDTQGNMHVAWTDSELYHRKRDVNGNWGAISALYNIGGSERAGVGSLVASPDGFVHAAYSVDDGSGDWRIRYKCYNGAWSGGNSIYTHAGTTADIDPVIYADAYSRLYIVFHDYNNILYATAASATSAWSGVSPIVAGAYLSTVPDIAIDTNLDAHVVWQARPTSGDNWDIWGAAQSVGTPQPQGTLTGEVRDHWNNLLPGATISTGSAAGITNASGQYAFPAPAGTHTVTCTRQYFTSQSATNVVITQSQTSTRNFQIASIAPGPATNLAVLAANRQNFLSWNHPSDGQFAGVLLRVRTDGVYPTGPMDGTLLGDLPALPGGIGNYTHANLVNGTTYRYALFAYDSYVPHSYAVPAVGSGTPAGPCDFDRDGDVDQADWGRFQACLTGEFIVQSDAACGQALLDADTDVDTNDIVLVVACISGPGPPSNPPCVP